MHLPSGLLGCTWTPNAQQGGVAIWKWTLVYSSWLYFWSAPLVIFSLLFTVVCETHVLEYEAIARKLHADEADEHTPLHPRSHAEENTPVQPRGLSSSLSSTWWLYRDAHAALLETSRRFLGFFLMPSALLLGAIAGILAADFTGHTSVASLHQWWIYTYMLFFFTFLFISLSVAAGVTDRAQQVLLLVNDLGLPHRPGDPEAEAASRAATPRTDSSPPSPTRTEVEQLMAYMEMLRSGIYVVGIRIDHSFVARFCVAMLSATAATFQRAISVSSEK